jgi:5-methylcytosine-specific restriction endonuclease McrA
VITAPVLVLNANYEPLNVCSTRRAVLLVLDGKAMLVANGRGVLRTVTIELPLPSVIRLAQMVHRPRPHIKLTKKEVLRRDDYTCQYCGLRAPVLTVDHVLPRHLGGKARWENLVTACAPCNHRKGGRTLEQAHMRLLRLPSEPPASLTYVLSRHLNGNEEWLPFIDGW